MMILNSNRFMKIRCINNTGKSIRPYEFKSLKENRLGRFLSTEYTQFGLEIGKEFLVMGMLYGEGDLDYLIDDGGYISAYPYPLFEVIDHRIPPTWYYKSFHHTDKLYPYREAVWGYYELVFDDKHYEQLVEAEQSALRIYFKRKIQMEYYLDVDEAHEKD